MRALAARLTAFLMGAGALMGASEFSRPHNHLGEADEKGRLHAWFEIAAIRMDKETVLPLRFLLAAVPASGAPLFGKFWWCPLFEATCVSYAEHRYVLSTLGGRHVYLREKDGKLWNPDGQWTGQLQEGGGITLSGPGNWQYSYQRGRLVRAEKADGPRLQWIYNGNRLTGIQDGSQRQIVSLEYGVEGLPSAIMLPTGRCELGVQNVPTVAAPMGQALISGYEPSLGRIATEFGMWSFPITFEKEGNYRMAFSNEIHGSRDYVWQAGSGVLSSDGAWTYSVTTRSDGRPLVSRKNAKGGVESYFYDDHTGVSEHIRPDGSRTERTYFVTRGPTWHKIRKLTVTKDGKETESWQYSYDDLGRLIRQRCGEYQKSWTYHPNGAVAEACETLREKNLLTERFDEGGRRLEMVKKDKTYRFAYEGGKTIVQRLQDGNIVSTKISDPTNGQAFFFVNDKGQQALRSATPWLAQQPSPQDLESIKMLAVKAFQATTTKE